jgi:hypothetical protein
VSNPRISRYLRINAACAICILSAPSVFCSLTGWGPSDRLDRARITQLMDETVRQKSPMKWTVYYEDEKEKNYSVAEIERDLAYLKQWFAWHPTWAHKNGKPVIFVWNEDNCDVAKRWNEAGRNSNWYVVLKLFAGYKNCASQPDSWHQYVSSSSLGELWIRGSSNGNAFRSLTLIPTSPLQGTNANGYLEYPPYSFTIAPGFWKANDPAPLRKSGANERERPKLAARRNLQ